MSNAQNAPRPEGEAGEARIGQVLQQARVAAHIEVNKICADLRISSQALEAIEQGNYHLLPGDPYVRALLGSMSRYLNVDSQAIVRGYNKEIGATQAATPVAPYNQENVETHKTAHKQIYVAIVIALFVGLFFIIGRLNKAEETPGSSPAGSAPSENLAAPAPDTSLESKSLVPDTALGRRDTARDTARARPAPASAPSGAAIGEPDTAGLNNAVLKPLEDSVGVRVTRYGKEDVAVLLRLGKQIAVSHTDTITVFTTKRRTVEVTTGPTTVVPDRKRFKIFKHKVTTF